MGEYRRCAFSARLDYYAFERLKQAAEAEGISPGHIIDRLIMNGLPPVAHFNDDFPVVSPEEIYTEEPVEVPAGTHVGMPTENPEEDVMKPVGEELVKPYEETLEPPASAPVSRPAPMFVIVDKLPDCEPAVKAPMKKAPNVPIWRNREEYAILKKHFTDKQLNFFQATLTEKGIKEFRKTFL